MFGHTTEVRGPDLEAAWMALQEAAPVAPIRTKVQHKKMLSLLDDLQVKVGENRAHPLADLLQIVADLVDDYESSRFPIPNAQPREVLRFLMEQHGLKQSDLSAELGTQSIVSDILAGNREINARQARALAKRFQVAPGVFI